MFQHSVMELIKFRTSFRRYTGEPLPESLRSRLGELLASLTRGPLGNPCRIGIFDRERLQKQTGSKRPGSPSAIREAPAYLAGAVRRAERALLDFGFLFELAILKSTDLGLGTCWLGTGFDRAAFGRLLDLGSDEILPAVSPLGYPTERRSNLDRIIRWAAGSKKRKSWSELFFEDSIENPLGREEAGEFARCLEMVRLAPSASNRQPWRIVKERGRPVFHFFLQRTAGYRYFTSVDLQQLDMGIAMCHFGLTAEALQMHGEWRLEPPERAHTPEGPAYMVSWFGKEL